MWIFSTFLTVTVSICCVSIKHLHGFHGTALMLIISEKFTQNLLVLRISPCMSNLNSQIGI